MNFKIGDSIDNYDDLRKLPEGTVLTARSNLTSGDRILETRNGVLGLWSEDKNRLAPLCRGETGKFPGILHYIIKELPEKGLTLDQIRSLPHGTTLRISGCTTHALGTAPDGTGWFSDYRIVEHHGSQISLRQVFSGGGSAGVLDITNITEFPSGYYIKGFYLMEELEDTADESEGTANELEAFKMKVIEVANRYATTRRKWCDVVDDALEELGLFRSQKRQVTFTVALDVELPRSIEPNGFNSTPAVFQDLEENLHDAVKEALVAEAKLHGISVENITVKEQ